jgi:hypothetical protein
MFRRVSYEDALLWVPMLAFAVSAFIYGMVLLRSMALRPERLRKMKNLPLE